MDNTIPCPECHGDIAMVATAQTRSNTYRRFESACQRATAKGIRVLAERNGIAIVSASNRRDAYFVANGRCSCAAAINNDQCCIHVAALFLHEQEAWETAMMQGEPA